MRLDEGLTSASVTSFAPLHAEKQHEGRCQEKLQFERVLSQLTTRTSHSPEGKR